MNSATGAQVENPIQGESERTNITSLPARQGQWFAVSRALFEHVEVGPGKPVKPADAKRGAYSQMEAWLWMVGRAAFRPREVMNKGERMTLQRGQLLAGRYELARQWNWTEKTVRCFLQRLVKSGSCHISAVRRSGQQKGNQVAIVTIAHYDRFQSPAGNVGPAPGPAK